MGVTKAIVVRRGTVKILHISGRNAHVRGNEPVNI